MAEISNYILATFPLSRRFAIDEEFFAEGNRLFCFQQHTVDDDIDFLIDTIDSVHIEEFTCSVRGCSETFTNPLQYNRHFDLLHRYRCQTCCRNFSSNYLLSLHISESHDAYFDAQKEKGFAIYECLVESCERKFKNAEKRRMHLIDKHKYPPRFRFNAVKRTHRKYTKKGGEKQKTDPKYETLKQNKDHNGDDAKMAVDTHSVIITTEKNEKPKTSSRKKSRKNKNKSGHMMDVSPSVGMVSDECDSVNMDVSQEHEATECKANKITEHKRSMPTSFCFGRGVPVFQKSNNIPKLTQI